MHSIGTDAESDVVVLSSLDLMLIFQRYQVTPSSSLRLPTMPMRVQDPPKMPPRLHTLILHYRVYQPLRKHSDE